MRKTARKTRKVVRASYSVADTKPRKKIPVDPRYAEYAATCNMLIKHYPAGSADLFLALDNTRRVYLNSLEEVKEVRASRRNREIAKLQGFQFVYPSNWNR